ncbi:MAG: hypothetical protein ACXQS5_00425 [Candidatus Methanospirareceae archaeon]
MLTEVNLELKVIEPEKLERCVLCKSFAKKVIIFGQLPVAKTRLRYKTVRIPLCRKHIEELIRKLEEG